MKMPEKSSTLSLAILGLFLIGGCIQESIRIENGDLSLIVSENLYTTIGSKSPSGKLSESSATEYLLFGQERITDFNLTNSHEEGSTGDGRKKHFITGVNTEKGLQKVLVVTAYDAFPQLLTTQVFYINTSEKEIGYSGWVNNAYPIESRGDEPPFWAFQGSSSVARSDWIKPVNPGFYQENYLGMNSSDYGGGIPVTDIWRPDIGLAVGHLELTPKLVSLPTEMKKHSKHATVGVRKDFPYPTYLAPGDTVKTIETFVLLHQGDYYQALSTYSSLMQSRGVKLPEPEPAAFEPIWCAWGYERNFTLEEVIGTLPKVKELGIRWAVLDDGFQQAEGDWHTNKKKFPGGDQQMKDLVDKIHDHGLKAKLWWAPLAVDPGSELLQTNPDIRLYLENWAPQYITWWDAYYLSPTHPKTITHTKETVNLFLKEWGFDGLKMDGQHLNALAPDHNPAARLHTPDEAPGKLPEFFRLIYEEAKAIKPNAVIENCPCGTCMSFFNMVYMNQAVSSDPTSSWQIRLKGKTYKALIPGTAYYGDHVELSDEGNDFASSFGVGAVLGTKFTWPRDNPTASQSFLLTPEKEKTWKKWFALYKEKMLSKENYRGELYDMGYDQPETHVIQKGDTLHYAFYAKEWTGTVTLKGLMAGEYTINDYFNKKTLGMVNSTTPQLDLTFKNFILIEAYPTKP